MHTTKSLKDKKKNHILFLCKQKFKKKLACTLALITSLLEP